MPIEIVLICSTAIVCVGIGLLSSLPTFFHLWPGLYGYEIITGVALSLASPPYFVLVATSIQEKEVAVGTGTLNMVRTLGGCVGVAICSAIHRDHLNKELSDFLSPEEIGGMQSSTSMITQLPDAVRGRVGVISGGSCKWPFQTNVGIHDMLISPCVLDNRQFRVMLAFAGLNVVIAVTLATVRKRSGLFGLTPKGKKEMGLWRLQTTRAKPQLVEHQIKRLMASSLLELRPYAGRMMV
jgi:hypothetical protein